MVVRVLEVIWVFDGCISPPGDKMMACVAPEHGFFFRINSKGHWPASVPLVRIDHPFLKWDSFLQCDGPLDLDEYVIEESLRQRAAIGAISRRVLPQICQAIRGNDRMAEMDKRAILAALA